LAKTKEEEPFYQIGQSPAVIPQVFESNEDMKRHIKNLKESMQ
jgi:hypothetical protein